jgi:glutamine synthetase
MDLAIHARDKQLAAMERVRDAADKLEKVVPDDLWPLPKYAEMLFIR